MNEGKFTKGEWHWEHDNETACTISVFNSNGVEICRLQSEDDAHLIAAAPEMYTMLDFLVNQLKGVEETIAWDSVEELLAKARGEL